MSLSAAPLRLDAVDTFLRAIGCNPDTVEEVHFNRDHLDVVTTAPDGCSVATRHRLVENPVAAVVRDALQQAAHGKQVGILFNTQAEATTALRALYNLRETVLAGMFHTIYLAAGRVTLNDTGGRVDFINVRGNAYRGQSWDLAYQPAGLSDRDLQDVLPTVPSGNLITYQEST